LRRLTSKISAPSHRGPCGLDKENVGGNAADVQGGDTIQHGILRGISTTREKPSPAESLVERFIRIAFGSHP
jgi:hypothetical protein